MTVLDLIESLAHYDPNSEVCFWERDTSGQLAVSSLLCEHVQRAKLHCVEPQQARFGSFAFADESVEPIYVLPGVVLGSP